jgi:hypothetical protein
MPEEKGTLFELKRHGSISVLENIRFSKEVETNSFTPKPFRVQQIR